MLTLVFLTSLLPARHNVNRFRASSLFPFLVPRHVSVILSYFCGKKRRCYATFIFDEKCFASVVIFSYAYKRQTADGTLVAVF